MPDQVTLDVTTIEENVTVETTAGDVVEIQVVAPTGPTGPAGPNSVTSATTSDGTANLSLSNVTTATATVSSLLTANHIHGNLAGTLYTHVRTGEAMSKGDPVYVSGFHNGTSQPIVSKADASNPAKMPAIGVMDADYLANVSSANCVIAGTITSVDTDAFSINSPVYVGNGGGFSETIGTIPQQVGIVERSNTNNGAFVVTNNKVVSFADVSDAQAGTAQLSLGDLEVVGGELYTNGEYSNIYTQGATAHIFTIGSGAEIYTEGELAQIYTTGASAQIYTAGAGATIGTQGANATIYTTGAYATISTAGSAAHIQTSHASAAVKSTNFAAVESGGASLVDGSMQPCLTWSAGGRNLTIPSGTAVTFDSTSYTYGTGAAAAHRTALGLTTLATTTPGTNVATFLATPTSANLAAAVTDETGSGSLVFATSPSLTSPTIGTSATFNATTYTYGSGAALAHRNALGVGTRISALASNTSVTNTTTLQTVASLSVVAGKSYAVYAQIAIDGTVLTGTRHGLTFPASTFIRMTRKRSSSYIPVEVTANLNLGLAETSTLAELVGFITVTVTGTVDLQFAQNTANANTTTCRTFTYLTLTELV